MDISVLINLILTHGYIIIFLLMLIEGPMTTFSASFLASQGYFNIYIIFLLAILGNLIPDLVLFSIGKFSKKKFIEKILKKFKIDKKKINLLELNIKKHLGKIIILLKLIPGLAIPGIIFIGFNKIKYKKFFIYGLLFDGISELIFLILGFYFGISSKIFLEYFKFGQFSIILLFLAVTLFYFLYKHSKKIILKKIEK